MLNFVSDVPKQSFLRLILVALLWASAALAVTLEDVFQVKIGSDQGGTDDHHATLQSWLDDTSSLVAAMVEAMPEDSKKAGQSDPVLREVLKANLGAYFKIRVNKNGGIHANDVTAYGDVRGKFVI